MRPSHQTWTLRALGLGEQSLPWSMAPSKQSFAATSWLWKDRLHYAKDLEGTLLKPGHETEVFLETVVTWPRLLVWQMRTFILVIRLDNPSGYSWKETLRSPKLPGSPTRFP